MDETGPVVDATIVIEAYAEPTPPGAAPGDPVLTLAMTVLAADKQARLRGVHARVTELRTTPAGGPPTRAQADLAVRAADEPTLAAYVAELTRQATARAERDGTGVSLTPR